VALELSTLLGVLYLTGLAAMGALTAHRFLKERSPIVLGALALPLGLAALLICVNLGLRSGFPLETALTATGVALLVLTLVMGRLSGPVLESDCLGRASCLLLGAMSLTVLLYTNQQQCRFLDDDYWIHTPLQAEMLKGVFPPHNPFFPELLLHGHYGRDLLIVAFSYLTGASTFWTQMAVMTGAQLCSFLLLWATAWRFTSSRVSAFTAVTMAFFGADALYRDGLFDAYTNNATLVYMWLWLTLFLVMKVSEGKRPLASTLLGAVILGSFGWVYETHFGLSVLATISATLCLERNRKALVWTALLLLLAAGVALTQGGPFTDLAHRVGRGPVPTGVMNQSQSVQMHFPKADLFCIREGSNESQPVSVAYQHWPASMLGYWLTRPSLGTFTYSSILSREVIKMHWLPLLLAPASLVVLLWSGQKAGLWLWFFGMWAYVVPSVIDFGPVHESEYFRWEFAASVCLSAALGLAAAWLVQLWAGDPEPRLDVSEETDPRIYVSVSLRARRWGALALLLWLCLQPAAVTLGNFWLSDWSLPEAGWLGISTEDWLDRVGPTAQFSSRDRKAAEFLAPRAAGGSRLLTNFHYAQPEQLGFESLFAGMTGVFCIGHALPLDSDSIGQPPSRMTPEAVEFWRHPNQSALRALGPDWIYLHPSAEMLGSNVDPAIRSLVGVTMVYEDPDAILGPRVIYQVSSSGALGSRSKTAPDPRAR
jgi:hypothetical protein